MCSDTVVCPQKTNKAVSLPQWTTLGGVVWCGVCVCGISRFRGVPLAVTVAFYYYLFFYFLPWVLSRLKAALLVHLSCSGQQTRAVMKSLQTRIFRPVVFTSVCPWQRWPDRPQLRSKAAATFQSLEAAKACSVLWLVK